MAKKKEKDLFAAPVENKIEEEVKMEEIKNEEVAVENQETSENQEIEMELEMDGEDVQGEMEELVAEKVQKEEKENKEQKSKRGPKSGKKDETPVGEVTEKPVEKKEKALNLNDSNIVQREIKKGRLAAPQARIEKTEAGDYILKLADGVIFPSDAKATMKEIERISKMNDGKFIVTMAASKSLNTDKFTAKHENGEEVQHSYVRVELHKPGREKDVVELFTVAQAKEFLKVKDAQSAKKEADAKKKEEKAAKEKAEKEAEEKKLAEDNKETQTA